MIVTLLGKTLELRRGLFEPLILEIVRAGLIYRQKSGYPVSPDEIQKLNGLILEVGFKFPDLWDPELLISLRTDGATRAREHVERVLLQEQLEATECAQRSIELEKLKREFFALHNVDDRNRAGLEFERILTRLFYLHDLSPREPFRVKGEQIDGSFILDYEIYLIEAKWQRDPSPEADLLVFRGKVEGKSKFTRGVFISVNGVSKDAADAITRGKQPNFFVVDGYDLAMLLEDRISLVDFLRTRQRLLAEEGKVIIPFPQLVF